MNIKETLFGKIVIDEHAPLGSLFLVPPVAHVIHENLMTGEKKEWFEWNQKAAGVITGIKK